MGSEMCIRDRLPSEHVVISDVRSPASDPTLVEKKAGGVNQHNYLCLLYTSDAADERSSVDLGGRRIIKKKNNRERATSGDRYINKNKDLNKRQRREQAQKK